MQGVPWATLATMSRLSAAGDADCSQDGDQPSGVAGGWRDAIRQAADACPHHQREADVERAIWEMLYSPILSTAVNGFIGNTWGTYGFPSMLA